MTTPACPCCKAKFAHDAENERCKKCGLPDELIAIGPEAVQAWGLGLHRLRRPERKAAKKAKQQVQPTIRHKSLYRKMTREKRNAAR